jgi:hypothetical protein
MSEEKKKKTIEEVMAEFAENAESAPSDKVSPAKRVQDTFTEELVDISENRPSIAEEKKKHNEELKTNAMNASGYVSIPIDDLPSGGIFYPVGTKINIRAASGADIRHWSMIDETEISQIDDALNYIIERCVTVSFPDQIASWKDLTEIDRFYLILSVRDFTFTEGHNELKIDISENDSVSVHKDNISFIDIPENILKHYNEQKRCFVFKAKTPSVGEINIYMPYVGVTQWLKQYVEKKSRMQESFDKEFITTAPMLIHDYRQLNDRTYTDLIRKTMDYGVYEWSLLSKIKTIFSKAITPKLVYNDKSGVEQETPLNFRGGIKSIFLDNNVDEELDL